MSDPPMIDPLFLSLQTVLAGRYSIDRELGRGGMGVVYLAREVDLDRLVAIKLLPPDRAADPMIRDRFLREARLAAKLSHPNIIPIHAVEDTGEFVFYVMAFVDGETLATRVRTRGPLSASEGARVLREVSWALAHAHGQGVVHRDIKPDNILMEAATGRVLVADFGIAAALGDATSDRVAGTPEFMSPEQALGKAIDARSDIYALGATAFYAFSARLPFEGQTATEVVAKHITEPAPPVASLGIAVPRRLGAIVDRCLAKDPASRPRDATALAEQLGVALEQRRELPVVLRAFVKRSARIDGGGALISSGAILVASIEVSSRFGLWPAFASLLGASIAAPFAYCTFVARRLRLQGFAHGDLAPAFDAELERTKEEMAVDRGTTGRTRAEKAVRVLMETSLGSSVVTMLGLLKFGLNSFPRPLAVDAGWAWAFATSIGATVTTGILYLSLLQQRRDVDNEFWKKVWSSWFGRAAFAVAGRLLGKRAMAPVMTHRATELSLGLAAEELFASLPKESRHQLGDVPAVLQRLQLDAQRLRKMYESIQTALQEAGGNDDAAIASLAESRDALHEKLREVVGSLETIRLSLLRLHAGSLTVASLTTHLDLAADMAVEVERLIAAHDDTERLLSFPSTPAPTPV